MKKSDRFYEKGSALLVVLGFLTFMIISAVSFSIYMRVDRQASSNYRHSITARHLLESALYRAIEEVDQDLVAAKIKFPEHWEGGRVFTSDPYPVEEVEDARVLSLEALSFLPAALVNDVRYYATSTNGSFGAKWRRMGMPINIKTNQVTSSGGKNFVGRYAYICVNMSDMLNINGCTATPLRSASNLVSVASLFGPNIGEKFETQRTNDLHYTTQQDFYACLSEASQDYFENPNKNSPAIEVLKNRGDVNTLFNKQSKQVLVTDGFAKVEQPRVASGKNVTDMSAANLAQDPKILELFANDGIFVQAGWPLNEILEGYLSPDNGATPLRLDVPSSKLTPMICQVLLTDVMRPRMVSEVTGNAPNQITEYKLWLVDDPNEAKNGNGLKIRLCFPFKNVKERIKGAPFTLSVEGFVRLDKKGEQPTLDSNIVFVPDQDIKFSGTTPNFGMAAGGVPDITGSGDAKTDQDACYFEVNVPLTFTPADLISTYIVLATKNDADVVTVKPGFNKDTPINIALVISSMTIKWNAQLVDSVPARPPGVLGDDLPKLYFQTGELNILAGASNPGTPMPYLWDSLEVPDPRFNHYVMNWVNTMSDPNRTAPGMHQITKDLLGKDGRDADIFMASSGAGKLQSVGELGFLIRPYNFDVTKGGKQNGRVDFQAAEKKQPTPTIDDSAAYFRTIRLYDHGANYKRDEVYKYLYMAADANGSLPLGSNVRINPLSTVGSISECAIDRIPYNFSIANGGSTLPKQNFTEGVLEAGWVKFVGDWANSFSNAVKTGKVNNLDAKKSVTDIYGDENLMKWYQSEDYSGGSVTRKTIFGTDASAPLYEIDRKMMYAFSLDSMSDRQELFLYVFQAESVPPITLKGMRSLSGGRAVAAVWRDPYPPHQHKILYFKQLDN